MWSKVDNWVVAAAELAGVDVSDIQELLVAVGGFADSSDRVPQAVAADEDSDLCLESVVADIPTSLPGVRQGS